MSIRQGFRYVMYLAILIAFVNDRLSDHKGCATYEEKVKIFKEKKDAPLYALCMTTLDKDGSPVRDWDQFNTPTRFHTRRQSMEKRILKLESVGPDHQSLPEPVNISNLIVTRFKNLTCTWLDWNHIYEGPNLKQNTARGVVIFELKMRFDKNTDHVYLIPKQSGDFTLTEEDLTDETNIHDLLLRSFQVSVGFNIDEKEVWYEETRLCPDNQKCISNCLATEALVKLDAIACEVTFTGNSDQPYTSEAKQFLPLCLPQCLSEVCIASEAKLVVNVDYRSIPVKRRVIEVDMQINVPHPRQKLIRKLPSLRPSLDNLMAIVVLWSLMEIVCFPSFYSTPFMVAIICFLLGRDLDNACHWII